MRAHASVGIIRVGWGCSRKNRFSCTTRRRSSIEISINANAVANAEAIIARHIERSRGTREKLTFVPDLRYGKHPDEMLDYFPAKQEGAPIPGVRTRGRLKSTARTTTASRLRPSFPPESSTAILNFSKLPHVRLPVLVDQVRRAVA